MNFSMNLFTGRELAAMRNIVQTGNTEFSAGIEEMKIRVAKAFPEPLWSQRYFQAIVIRNALTELGAYNTCEIAGDWVWYVPGTPRYVIPAEGGKPIDIRPIAYPERYNEYLEAIVNRPISELATIVKFLAATEDSGFLYPLLTCTDSDRRYWKLTWREPKFWNLNVIYIRKGTYNA